MVTVTQTTDLATSVRRIAKTDELTSKVNKLALNSPVANKAGIVAQRALAYLDPASGATGIDGGGSAAADKAVGVGADGKPLTGPLAGPLNNSALLALIAGVLAGTSKGAASSADSNISFMDKDKPTNTNLDSKAQAQANGGGGSAFADQGLLGEGNADWLAIKAALIAKGATQAEIDAARRQFLKKQLGIDEVSDVFKGDAGPKPADVSQDASAATPKEVLRGIVGVNPDNPSQAMLIRLDGVTPTPSDADADKVYQDSWLNGTPIVRGFQLGFNWTPQIPGAPQYFSSPTAAAQAYITYLGTINITATQTAFVPSSVGGAIVSYDLTVDQVDSNTGTVIGPSTSSINRAACTPGSGANCPLEPPAEQFWPKTNLGVATYLNGTFVASIFDSEAPIQYKSPTSSAIIRSAATGLDYTVEPAINGGFMISQDVASPYSLVYGSDGTLRTIVPTAQKNFYSPRSS